MSSSQRSAYVIGSMMDLRRYRLLDDGDFEENFSPFTTTTVCSDEPSDVETFRHELDFLDEIHNVGSFQPVLEAISEENLDDLHEVMDMGHLELDGSTVALYGSPHQWKSRSRSLSPLTSCTFEEQGKSITTVTIEMKEMTQDGHYLEAASSNETSLENVSSLEMVKNSFLNRLGLLTKHRTLSDISDVNYSPSVITDDLSSRSEFHEDTVGDANRTVSKELECESNQLDANTDTQFHASEILKIGVIDVDNNGRENETSNLIKAKSIHNTSPSFHYDSTNEEVSEAKEEKMYGVNVDLVVDGKTDLREETCVDSWCNFEMINENRSDPIEDDYEDLAISKSELKANENDSESIKSKISDADKRLQETSSNFELSGTIDSRQNETLSQSNSGNCNEKETLTEGDRMDSAENVNQHDDMNLPMDCVTNSLSPKKFEDHCTSPTQSTASGKEKSPRQVILSDQKSHSEDDDDDSVDHNSFNGSPNSEETRESIASCSTAVGGGGTNILIAKYSDETYHLSGDLPEKQSYSESNPGDILDRCPKEPFTFDHINTMQMCHYNTWQEQSEENESTNTYQLEGDEKSLGCDFSNEIELEIHNNIDLVEVSSVEEVPNCEEDYLENVDLDYNSVSNNSSFINISWSQTDNITRKKKVKRDTCFTQ